MRKSRIKVAGVAVFLSLVPFLAGAVTAEELDLQIQSLLAQISALRAQLGATPSPASPPAPAPTYPASQGNNCPQLTRALSLGARGQDVLQLQQFLIAQNLLGTDSATGYFGPLTEGAVQRWQTSHGIVSSGGAASTGWGSVGARTRSMIALNCNITNLAPTPTPSCPIAPPPSTICGAGWQANTDSKGCTISYRCSIPLSQPTPSPNVCTAIGFIQPTSYCSGTWQPTHNSMGCQNGWQCVPITSSVATSSGSFSASPTSGNAPLSVVFSVPSTSGQNKTLYFGDGSSDVTGCQTTAAWTTTHTYATSSTYYPYLATPCTTSGTTYSLGQATIIVGSTTNRFFASPSSGNAPLTVSFSGTVNSAGYSIDFGDGTSSGDVRCGHGGCPPSPSSSSVNTTHAYTSPGTYVAKLRQHFSIVAGNCAGTDCNVVGTVTITVP